MGEADCVDGASGGAGVTDPYHSLGLEPEAGPDEIRLAYRKLARQFHPDGFADAPPKDQRAAHERMQEINQAFAVLTDPVERRRFERQRRLRERRSTADDGPPRHRRAETGDDGDDTGRVRFGTRSRASRSAPPDHESQGRRAWRAEPPPPDLWIREFSGWGDAHWVYVHAPGGRAGKMNLTTGEVTVEREELREDVFSILRHYAIGSW